MAIKAIVAVDRQNAIGRGGALPWHYPEDLRFFKRTTSGHAVLMGRKTFDSIGRPLPNRMNIVLTRSDVDVDGVIVVRSPEDVMRLAVAHGHTPGMDLFVMGGAQVYRAMLPYVEEWIVTRIPLTVPHADTFLPGDSLEGFRLADQSDLGSGLTVEYHLRT